MEEANIQCPLGLTLDNTKRIHQSDARETVHNAINRTDIESIQREQKTQNERLSVLEKKINWLFTTMIATLLVGFVNLVILFFRFFVVSGAIL